MIRFLFSILFLSSTLCFSQNHWPHENAHAHNDYEHVHPLMDALQNGFISVEADVHLHNGKLLVSHDRPDRNSSSLEDLYLAPLDSLLKINSGRVYKGSKTTFYLMIDIKTEAKATYQAIKRATANYPALLCTTSENCAVQIFLSGNRPISMIAKEDYSGLAVDGHPSNVGKGFYSELMPVVSDHFNNWSGWNGKTKPTSKDLQRIKELAQRVHAEGKKLRLWAIPDNELAWETLLDAGVDFINTDRLKELNAFLSQREP
jgi:glycerophosphoryl diester phosphodiesterase